MEFLLKSIIPRLRGKDGSRGSSHTQMVFIPAVLVMKIRKGRGEREREKRKQGRKGGMEGREGTKYPAIRK